MSDVLLLDVGHGNCTVIQDAGVVAVIDSPAGSTLLDALEDLGVTRVDFALISHADADHIQGVLALLTSQRISVGCLYLNPDRDRNTVAWRDLLSAVKVAERTHGFRTCTSLNTVTPGTLKIGGLTATVVSPSTALALSAVDGRAPEGGLNSANTLSAVIKVERAPDTGVLLAGDLDRVALEDIKASGLNLKASALVYPHHGGLPGSVGTASFVHDLLNLVQPTSVYVSNGRNRHGNPRSEVVETITEYGCGLACTQMARACGEPVSVAHLEKWPAAGRGAMHSCAGSISLTLEATGAVRDAAGDASFREFVATQVSTPMCIRTKH